MRLSCQFHEWVINNHRLYSPMAASKHEGKKWFMMRGLTIGVEREIMSFSILEEERGFRFPRGEPT
jgi:hypothetical protein